MDLLYIVTKQPSEYGLIANPGIGHKDHPKQVTVSLLTSASLAPFCTAERRRSFTGVSLVRMNNVPLFPRDNLKSPSGDRYVMSIQPCSHTKTIWASAGGEVLH